MVWCNEVVAFAIGYFTPGVFAENFGMVSLVKIMNIKTPFWRSGHWTDDACEVKMECFRNKFRI